MTGTTDRAAIARRALALVDLTELGDAATGDDVSALCERADGPHGAVAAVCVWPRFVILAKSALRGTAVRIATVTNFPSGAQPIGDVVAETRTALSNGADEIDVVLPYRQFAAGDVRAATALLDAMRETVPHDGTHLLKVILETGELGDLALVDAAARLAIGHGADFIKTSTGKTPRSASLAATEVMLAAIRDVDRRVGLKPSGGIRVLDDAAAYLDQADLMMGSDWVSPRTFRIGASGLLTAILAELPATPGRPDAATNAGH
jgi:deoxyribose-phosphate aldolase